METRQEHWGGLAAGYFFLASMGCMMMMILALFDFANTEVFLQQVGGWIALAACILIAIGALMLVAELGNKKKIYHLHKPGIMLLGAAAMAICAVCAFVYATFFVSFLPWTEWLVLRRLVAAVGLLAGFVFVLYPGPEMAEAPGRPFWRRGGLMVLFFLVSIPVGLAGILVIGAFSATPAMFGEAIIINSLIELITLDKMWIAFAVTLAIGCVAIFAYLFSVRSKAAAAAYAVKNILSGEFKVTFWLVTIVIGIAVPLILAIISIANSDLFYPGFVLIASFCAIIGNACFRAIVLFAGVRVVLPGEEKEFITQEEITGLAAAFTEKWQEKAKWLSGR